ncbi:MAG: amino acid adenylation domain-containing protein [Acidimicrobiia bacterium]
MSVPNNDALPVTANGKVDIRTPQAAYPPTVAANRPASDRLAERLRNLSGAERAAVLAALREKSAAADSETPRGDVIPGEQQGATDEGAGATPLSFSQERLWFLDRLDPGSAAYNMKIASRLEGPLDESALRAAFGSIEARHAVLRTRYPDTDGQPRQVVEPVGSAPFEFIDGSANSSGDTSRLLRDIVSEPFDLAEGPIWRIRLIRTGADTHLLIIVIHHIAADGWSIPVLISELEELYTSRLLGRRPDLPTLPIQYADHARRQRRRFTSGAFDEGLSYWAQQLAGPLTPLDLPTDRPRPQLQTSRGGRIEFEFDDVDTAKLNDLCAREGATPSIVWLALFKAFLYRYSGMTDIVVGGPSADRDVEDTERLVGFFVNTLAYRTVIDSSWTFRELLGAARRTALDAYQHREVPFERVVIEADPERDPSRTPIFQVMLQYSDRFGRALRFPGVTANEIAMDFVSSKFDLELELAGGEERILGRLTFNADLYDEQTVRRMMSHFGGLVRSAIDEPDRAVEELSLMGEQERNQLLADFSGEDSVYSGVTVVEKIQGWEDRTPSATAVAQGGRSLSYAELGTRARSIASRLAEEGVSHGDRVALLMSRSPDLIAAILGVLWAGAAYVPLDPAAPDERNGWVLEDSGPAAVLVDAEMPLPSIGVPVVSVSGLPEADADPNSRPSLTLNAPAYIIYTSGSTGRPKGVVVEHRSLAAFAAAANDLYGLKNKDRLLQFHSVAFDTSVEEIFSTLTAGGQLVLRTEDMAGSIERVLEEIENVSISVLQFPTAFWNIFAAHVLRDERPLPSSVHTVIIGGEAADPSLVDRWKRRFDSSVRLINAYGPTETTVTATAAILSDLNDPADAPVPIGKPLGSATAFVVDRAGQAVPIGVRGELWIGGPQVARGYFDAPELTDEQFVAAPFGRVGRVYRTGDVVRWRPDGNLEFLGRVDRQLKVRGFRIEPGEIEAQLVLHPDVSVAFVHLWEDTREPVLVGYVVAEPGRTPVTEELVDHLKNSLPAYMVPAVEVIDELPRNQSDKVDTKRLPEPSRRGRSHRTPPRSDTMIRMAALWSEILGVEDIGIEDRFFDLGGHSLMAVEMISRVEREFRVSVPLATIFSHPSLEEFTHRVTSGTSQPLPDRLVPIKPDGDRRPLFCLPVTDGSVLAYHRLTRHLSSDIPIYGIEALGADGVSAPHRTIEDMCHEFADIIMATGPGPYRLLGASYAGLLAVETANSIIERGGEIDLAVMLDTVMPHQESWLERQQRRERIIRSRGTSGLGYVSLDLWKRARVRLGKLRHAPRWRIREMAGQPLSAELAGKRLTHASLEAERRFAPRPYRGMVLYFRATGEDLPLDEHRDAPWRRYVEDLDVVDSAGTHWGEGSMLDEPHLADLCNELNNRFASSDEVGRTP